MRGEAGEGAGAAVRIRPRVSWTKRPAVDGCLVDADDAGPMATTAWEKKGLWIHQRLLPIQLGKPLLQEIQLLVGQDQFILKDTDANMQV